MTAIHPHRNQVFIEIHAEHVLENPGIVMTEVFHYCVVHSVQSAIQVSSD